MQCPGMRMERVHRRRDGPAEIFVLHDRAPEFLKFILLFFSAVSLLSLQDSSLVFLGVHGEKVGEKRLSPKLRHVEVDLGILDTCHVEGITLPRGGNLPRATWRVLLEVLRIKK